MIKKILIGSVFILGGCASFIDSSVQEIEFQTPGAKNAVCDVYIERLRYTVNPPEVVGVHKSEADMIVDCQAPGNRRRKVYIKPAVSGTTAWNIANGGAGLPYDYLTKAMFEYPEVVIVDFTGVPVVDNEPPAHNSPDIRQPEDYDLEEFSPGSPRLNSDRNKVETKLLRRGEDPYGWGNEAADIDYNDGFSESPASGKGDLMNASPYPAIPGE
ncbi:MAG: hypothetical protein KTR28_01700 [Micavibrio sp.]|nr:hypothetical protein [Micavibrio sp.]